MAFQVYYWQGASESQGTNPVSFTQPSTLAPGSQAELRIPGDWESWTIFYKGSDRQERRTTAYRDPNKPQEHVIRKGLQEIHLA